MMTWKTTVIYFKVTPQHLHRSWKNLRKSVEEGRDLNKLLPEFTHIIKSTFMNKFCCKHLKHVFSFSEKQSLKSGRLSVQLSGSELCYRFRNLTLSWEENRRQSGISSWQQKFLVVAFLQIPIHWCTKYQTQIESAMLDRHLLEVTGSEWDVQRFETE